MKIREPIPQIDEVLECVNKESQTLLFSATFPEEIVRFSKKYLNNPERIAVSAVKANAPKIKHEMIKISDSEKYNGLLDQIELRQGSILIFVKTQHGTERLAKRLDGNDIPSIVIHGGLRQSARDRAVREFRQQRSRILIATDVAARGLDIPHIEHVINYDLPQVAEDYVHRIGRTGRNGAEGHAMCFVIPSEIGKWNAINRVLNPGAAPERKERSEGGSGRGQGRGGQRPSRGSGQRDYKNASGFNSRKRTNHSNDDIYESRSGGRTERKEFRDGDFRDNRSNDRNNDRGGFRDRDFRDNRGNDRNNDRGGFRDHDSRDSRKPTNRNFEGKRTPTDKNWNAKEDRKEYRSEFRNDFSDNRERPQRNFKKPSGKAVMNNPYRGEGYHEARGDGYEGQNRNNNSFGVKPRGNGGKPAGKSGKPTGGKKPFASKGNDRKPSRDGQGNRRQNMA